MQALGLPTVLEKPFSPLSAKALTTAGQLAQEADVIVVCEVPFGSGNIKNLDLARQPGKLVLLNTRQVTARDFTPQREVPTLIDALLASGATPWEHVGDLLVELEKMR